MQQGGDWPQHQAAGQHQLPVPVVSSQPDEDAGHGVDEDEHRASKDLVAPSLAAVVPLAEGRPVQVHHAKTTGQGRRKLACAKRVSRTIGCVNTFNYLTLRTPGLPSLAIPLSWLPMQKILLTSTQVKFDQTKITGRRGGTLACAKKSKGSNGPS